MCTSSSVMQQLSSRLILRCLHLNYTNHKMLEMLQNPNTKAYIEIELVATVDAGEGFVKACTYNLEVDSPLLLRCLEVLSALAASIQVGYYPNVCRPLLGHCQEGGQLWYFSSGLIVLKPVSGLVSSIFWINSHES